VTATWWAPETAAGNFRRQYMVVFRHDNGTWQTRSVSQRTTDPTTTRYNESFVRNLGRPIVVVDDDDRIIVAYRDNQGSNTVGIANGITIVHSLPKAEDPDRLVWIAFDLTHENLGNYEPIIDNELWDRERQLHFIYQPSAGQGYTPPANTAARISVLEWDAKAYFATPREPSVAMIDGGSAARLAWPSDPSFTYRLYTSGDLDSWTLVGSFPGTGNLIEVTHSVSPNEPKRFWRLERIEGRGADNSEELGSR
jgi:hypothetical protein